MINWPNCNSYDLPLIGFNQTAHVQGHCKCFVILIMVTKIIDILRGSLQHLWIPIRKDFSIFIH